MSDTISARVRELLDNATPDGVRYIKLGEGNSWWHEAKATNTLRLGFREFHFDQCQAGDFESAKAPFARSRPNLSAGKVTSARNQVAAFFTLPRTSLWFTLADGDLWWCFAEESVIDLYHDRDDEAAERRGARSRKVIDRWCNTDVNGGRLQYDTMTTRITKVMSFQETICKPDGRVALLRTIRCKPSEERQLADAALNHLVQHLGDLLDQLHQDDFELLVELIFSSSGWRRISPLGGNQKFFDMTMMLPTTGEKCGVQVKSQTSAAVFNEYIRELAHHTGYARTFFVYHTPPSLFENPDPTRASVWSRPEIARQAIDAGLAEWVLQRTT
jgi:hypothetical protein